MLLELNDKQARALEILLCHTGGCRTDSPNKYCYEILSMLYHKGIAHNFDEVEKFISVDSNLEWSCSIQTFDKWAHEVKGR